MVRSMKPQPELPPIPRPPQRRDFNRSCNVVSCLREEIDRKNMTLPEGGPQYLQFPSACEDARISSDAQRYLEALLMFHLDKEYGLYTWDQGMSRKPKECAAILREARQTPEIAVLCQTAGLWGIDILLKDKVKSKQRAVGQNTDRHSVREDVHEVQEEDGDAFRELIPLTTNISGPNAGQAGSGGEMPRGTLDNVRDASYPELSEDLLHYPISIRDPRGDNQAERIAHFGAAPHTQEWDETGEGLPSDEPDVNTQHNAVAVASTLLNAAMNENVNNVPHIPETLNVRVTSQGRPVSGGRSRQPRAPQATQSRRPQDQIRGTRRGRPSSATSVSRGTAAGRIERSNAQAPVSTAAQRGRGGVGEV